MKNQFNLIKKNKMKSKKMLSALAIFMLVSIAAVAQDYNPDKKILYKEINGDSLYLHVFEPEVSKKPTAAIVFFFGGGWVGGNPKQFYQQSAYFSSRGILAISAEYRIKKEHNTTPFDCVEDGKSAIRWVREHAKELHIDPDKIVASGGSAGGHVAMCTALVDGLENTSESLNISSVPNAVAVYNPVLDTTKKGYGSEKVVGRETEISPCHLVKENLPPMLVCHGKDDTTVPFENAERFAALMKAEGNTCKLVSFDGVGHGFFNGNFFKKSNTDAHFNATMYDTDVFLKKLHFIKGKPSVKRD